MAVTDQPERFYTPYQRRAVVSKLASTRGIDLVDAGQLFLEMETADDKKLRALVDKFPADPPKQED